MASEPAVSILKEHPVQDDILATLPYKDQQGFKTFDVNITCLDAGDDHLLFGTNAGAGFLFNRETRKVIKLLSENRQDIVTCVKFLVGIECQVALGTEDGKLGVIIFSHSASQSTRQVHKYLLGNIHQSEVTCMIWSSNGMKLFSGDKNGNVYQTEVDFEKNKCSASLVFSEQHEIIQLNYKHMVLLASTYEQTLIFHMNRDENKMILVGSKPKRKGSFGSCFNTNTVSASDLQIFSTRPNLRIWIADIDGKVSATLQMKELTSSSHPRIMLEGDGDVISTHNADLQFSRVLMFKENFLVTYTDSSLFVIDWKVPSIIGSNLSMDGILDVATTTDEIWVLCKNRRLHRISEIPEKLSAIQKNLIAKKKEENQGVNMQDVKESISEMKKGFKPLVGALQSKMSNFNTENWTQKLQSQAKVLQSKLPSSIFTYPKPNVVVTTYPDISEKSDAESSETASTGSPSTSRHLKQKPSSTTSSSSEDVPKETDSNSTPVSDMSQEKTNSEVITQYCYATETNNNPMISSDLSIFDLKKWEVDKTNHDHLRSQGDPTLRKEDVEISQLYFDKRNNLDAEFDGDIVFNSKRKKRAQKGNKSPSTDNGSFSSENSKEIFELHSSLPEVSNITTGMLEMSPVSTVHDVHKVEKDDPGDSIPPDFKKLAINPVTEKHQEENPQHLSCKSEGMILSGNENLDNQNAEVSSSKEDLHTSDEETTNDFQELIIAVHKTSGNQLCPEIMLSPASNKSFIAGTSNLQEGNDTFPETEHSVSTSACQTRDHPETALIHESSKPGEEKVPDINDFNDTPNAGETTPTNDDQHVNLDTFSSIDDIYKVEESGRDFESELDSEEDAQVETILRSSSASISSSSTSQSFSESSASSVPVRLRDSWTVTSTPSQVITIAGSCNYIWYIDYYNQIFITEETGESKIRWKKLAKKAVQLAVSPTGDFVWIVTRSGNAYAAELPINFQEFPEPVQLNWKLVCPGVSRIALIIDQAWVTTSNGGVKVQFELSRQNPCNEAWTELACTNEKVSHITLTKTSAWCRTETGKILSGDISAVPEKKFEWKEVDPPIGDNAPLPILAIANNCNDVLWAVDDRGCLWFLNEDHEWWQVNTSQYVNENHNAVAETLMKTLPSSVSNSMHKVQSWMHGNVRVQHVAANDQSVWIVFDKNKVQIARGPLTGLRWDVTTPLAVAKSTRWQHITTSSVFSPDHGTWIGLVWAAQPSNEIFCFPSQEVATTHPVTLVPPLEEDSSIATISACKEALWVLMQDGLIHIRSGISSECLGGTQWSKLDVSTQLGKTKIIHVSCGTQNVWALDSTGQVYFRTGVTAVDAHSLLPAWIPIDGCQAAGCRFIQIESSSSDSFVWALDNFANVYVRSGVCPEMPIGLLWEIVPGSRAIQLCISNHTVWGLRMSGNLLRRYGISERNPVGDYWKKLKGRFIKLAVTPYDELWAIDQDQRLRHHKTAIYCTTVVRAQYQIDGNHTSKDSDWTMAAKGDVDWVLV